VPPAPLTTSVRPACWRWTAVRVPTLVVQGEADPFGRPEEFPADQQIVVVPSADHGFKVPRRAELSQDDVRGLVVEAALEFIVRDVVGNRPASHGVGT
jgi:predicted alpha/beta-hydrolase family hydrolase